MRRVPFGIMTATSTVRSPHGSSPLPVRKDRPASREASEAPGPPTVTLDLWHTLLYLEPTEEEQYMTEQRELATAFLESASPLPGAPALAREVLAAAFEAQFLEALAASREGRTVSPADQLVRAASATARVASVEEYLRELAALVDRADFHVAEGAAETLDRFRQRGYRTALVSNTTGETGAALRPVLRRLGLDRSLDELVFSDEQPWSKPAPEIFFEALRRVGGTPERSVHVGDGWADIEGARRAGFRAGILFTGLQRYGTSYQGYFVRQAREQPSTPYRVGHLSEVPGLVEDLVPGRRA